MDSCDSTEVTKRDGNETSGIGVSCIVWGVVVVVVGSYVLAVEHNEGFGHRVLHS